jgi:hypothetical protein
MSQVVAVLCHGKHTQKVEIDIWMVLIGPDLSPFQSLLYFKFLQPGHIGDLKAFRAAN